MKELILRNRNDFREVVCDLINWSNSKRIAEIGIWRGELSRKIIERCSPIYLLLVDPLKVENNKIGTYQCTMGESIKTQEELAKIEGNYVNKRHNAEFWIGNANKGKLFSLCKIQSSYNRIIGKNEYIGNNK